MRVPLSWLKEFVPIRLNPEALAHRLTMAGLEVKQIERVGDDTVFEIEVTPNRPDCLSVAGVAREAAFATGGTLKRPKPTRFKRGRVTGPMRVRVESQKDCPRYTAHLIEGVRIGPSPAWMVKRLTACGVRPINNVVDVTNHVLLGWGQPLHAFDLDRLSGGQIHVRRATPDEILTLLDGKKLALSKEWLVIADAQRPVALAGVMGGVGSEIHEGTTRILLESACFDRRVVRRQSRQAGVVSESSYRFERGVNIYAVRECAERACALIQQLAGGTVSTQTVDVGRLPRKSRPMKISQKQIQVRLGCVVPASQLAKSLKRLGARIRVRGDRWQVTAPDHRLDWVAQEDCLEEAARAVGYEAIPSRAPSIHASSKSSDWQWSFSNRVRDMMTGMGLSEVITHSLISSAQLERCRISADTALRLKNPLSSEQECMRPSLLATHLAVCGQNASHQHHSVAVYEVGAVYENTGVGRPREPWRLGWTLGGRRPNRWGAVRNESFEFGHAKGVFQNLVTELRLPVPSYEAASLPFGVAGASFWIHVGNERIGLLAQVEDAVGRAFDTDTPLFFGEVDLETLHRLSVKASIRFRPLPRFPHAVRDVSLELDQVVTAGEIIASIMSQDDPRLLDARLFDVYQGKNLPGGKKSLAFSCTYGASDRTLTDEEINALHRQVSERVAHQFGARIR